MLDFILSSWLFWLTVSIALIFFLKFFGKHNTDGAADSSMATTSDQFSMKAVFFSIRTGEARIFLVILASAVSFFLASIGFVHEMLMLFTTT